MKQAALLALMICLGLLTGCGSAKRNEESFLNWREDFAAQERHFVSAEVTAVAEESETVFALSCEYSEDGTEIEVLQPSAIAGVKARTEAGESTLCFDGAVLSLGEDFSGEASPLAALSLFFDFIVSGHIESVSTEKLEDAVALVTELENDCGQKMLLWQDMDSMQPRFAAIRSGDETELKIQIQKIE